MNISPNDGPYQTPAHGHPDNVGATNPPLKWYYLDGDRECGPNTTEEIQGLLSSGSIPTSTYVFREGMKDWATADSLEELGVQASLGTHASSPVSPQSPSSPRAPKSMRLGLVLGCIVGVLLLGTAGWYWGVRVPRLEKTEQVRLATLAQQNKEGHSAASPRSPVVAEPIEITVSEKADEPLFLMNLLEHLYSQLPADFSDPKRSGVTLDRLRYEATRHYEDIRQKSLDARLVSVFADFVAVIDAYNELLVNYGRIERSASALAERQSAESGFSAGFNGGETIAQASDNGASDSSALLQGVGVGLVDYLWTEYNNGKERDTAKQQALQDAGQAFKNKYLQYYARAQNAALDLSRAYSWERGEAGFGDVEMVRSRDPFQLSQQAYNYAVNSGTEPPEMVSAANQCIVAASLVPSGAIYDEYRLECLWKAAYIKSSAAGKEIGNRSWAAAYNRTAANAVQAWKACLQFSPDGSGECRQGMFMELMASGNFDEALSVANSIVSLRQNDSAFAYNYACLLSATKNTDNAFKWFDFAVRNLGYNNITWAKADPDLEAMRRDYRKQFDDLVAVKTTWNVEYGVFSDDVVVHNNSAFPLTHVVVNGAFTSRGREQRTGDLKADWIGAGTNAVWMSAISIQEGSPGTLSLACDQNR